MTKIKNKENKLMKKIGILAMVLAGAMALSACGAKNETEVDKNNSEKPSVNNENVVDKNDKEETGSLQGKLSDIIDKIYENVNTNLNLMTMDLDLTDLEGLPYYTGLTEATKIKEATVSESAFGSQAYSLVLVRLNDEADAKDIAEEMLEKIDTRKWICAEADDVKVAAYGDVVMFIMTSSQFEDSATADDIVKAFEKVCGAKLDVNMTK